MAIGLIVVVALVVSSDIKVPYFGKFVVNPPIIKLVLIFIVVVHHFKL